MNHEHEKLKMNVRAFVDVIKTFEFNQADLAIINSIKNTVAFREMDKLSKTETEVTNGK